MADARTAIMLTLQNEDRGLTGRITIDNNGAKVKFGINAADNPDLWDSSHPDGPSLEDAITRYASIYWPHAFSSLTSQRVANIVFDLGVNMGKFHAAQIFQRAISHCGATVVIDGVAGAETVAAANSCDESALLAAIVADADEYYTLLAQNHPEDAVYLKGWLARVKGDAGVPLDPGLTAE